MAIASGRSTAEIVEHALRYGIPLIIGGALGWVGLNASRFIVNEMSGVAAAGLFAVGYGLGQRAAAVAAMLVTAAAFPLAVKSMEQEGSQAAHAPTCRQQRAAVLPSWRRASPASSCSARRSSIY